MQIKIDIKENSSIITKSKPNNEKELKMTSFKGNNRATIVENGITKFILHSTVIVKNSDNGIQLNSDGWLTATTKKAMNEVGMILGFNVYQKAKKWYVDFDNKTYDYNDGIVLTK